MALNIKDPLAHELAQALAQQTGETMTQAVVEALRERLERLRRAQSKATADELLAIGQRCAKGISKTPIDHDELLYDDQGLPR